MPIVPATWEAEAELLEPRRQRLQWAEITPLHSSMGNKSETPSQKKKNTLRKQKRGNMDKDPAKLSQALFSLNFLNLDDKFQSAIEKHFAKAS